jgi:hypothetical protein
MLKHYKSIVYCFSLMLVVLMLSVAPVGAQSPAPWSTGNIRVEKRDDLSTNPDMYGLFGSCTYQTVQLPDTWGNYRDTSACIFRAKSFKYTITTEGHLFIGMDDKQLMYPVSNIGFYSLNYIVPSPNTNDIIFASSVIKDLPTKVTLTTELFLPYYEMHEDFIKNLAIDNLGNLHDTYGSAVSRNGEWMVINFRSFGFVRFNLNTQKATYIAPNRGYPEFMAISNDGNYLAITPFSNGETPAVYSLSNCGLDSSSLQSEWATVSSPFAMI